MKHHQIPSLLLAVALHVVPVTRVLTTQSALVTPGVAIVARWIAAVVGLLGAVDAVSGASVPVYVAGVQSLLPALPGVKTNITGRVGSPMVLRIILGGSVGQQPQLDYYNASPLPPGLIINTNVNTNSVGLASTNYYIYGTPTMAGVWYPVTVSAGNLLFPTVATTNILITITNASGVSPPTITTQPQSRTVTNGGSASFSVTASGSPRYQWRKDGVNLAGATNAMHTVSSATTNDTGNYTVIAVNAGGSVTSMVATLTVLVPPSIATQPQSLTVTNGDTASFQVTGIGLPPPQYQWLFNGVAIAGATNASLVITNTQPGHAGDYSVEVTNAAGLARSAVAHLTVQVLAGPMMLENIQVIAGVAQFDVTGPPGVPIVISTSTNLLSWTPIHTNSSPGARWRFADTNSTGASLRFFGLNIRRASNAQAK